MPILDPEIASAFGAIDSDAIADGQPVSAHVLRTMAMQRNRLVAQAQPLFNLVWPTHDTTETAGAVFGGYAPLTWTRIHPPIPVRKRPGLFLADFRMTANISNGHEVHLQIATQALPFRENAATTDENVVSVTGTGLYADIDLDGVPISRGPTETVEVWLRGIGTGTAGLTSVGGSPTSASFDQVSEESLIDFSATWNRTAFATTDWANGGHYVEIQTSGGQRVIPGREISAVDGFLGTPPPGNTNAIQLRFWRPLSGLEVQRARAARNYAIYQLPTWAFSNIAAVAQARTR